VATLAAVLAASLLGSLHCAGMCGALVAFAVGDPAVTSRSGRAALHAAYHGGRLASYAVLGALCGLVGAAVDLGGSMVGLNRLAAVVAGAMMVAVGVVALLHWRGFRLKWPAAAGRLGRLVVLAQRAALGLRPFPRALVIGLLTALLPCGWLYAFAIVAAGTGSALWGGAVMAAFWAGTVPVLACVGVGVQTLSATLGRRVPLVTALVLVALGLVTILGRSAIDARAMDLPAAATSDDPAGQIETIRQTPPPCCRQDDRPSQEE
jgi:sulfite exporter TauE/SafE